MFSCFYVYVLFSFELTLTQPNSLHTSRSQTSITSITNIMITITDIINDIITITSIITILNMFIYYYHYAVLPGGLWQLHLDRPGRRPGTAPRLRIWIIWYKHDMI